MNVRSSGSGLWTRAWLSMSSAWRSLQPVSSDAGGLDYGSYQGLDHTSRRVVLVIHCTSDAQASRLTSELEVFLASRRVNSGLSLEGGGRHTPPGAGEVTSPGPVARSRIRESGITLTQAEADSQWT